MSAKKFGVSCHKCTAGWEANSEDTVLNILTCPKCHRYLDSDDRYWVCSSCNSHNNLDWKTCRFCGSNKDGSKPAKRKGNWW